MEVIGTCTNVSKTNNANPNARISEEEEEEASPYCSSEESGWTAYFEDFLESKEDNKDVGSANSLSSSLMSDASSSRFISTNKTKRKKLRSFCSYDKEEDLLEDTACSTLNTNIHHEEMENNDYGHQAANGMPHGFGFQAANGLQNGFDFGLDLVNSVSRIDCSALQYNKRRHLTTLSSYVQGC